MKRALRLMAPFLGLILLQLVLAGCGGSKTSRFYTLNPVKSPASAVSSGNDQPAGTEARFSVGIFPVEIPDYLDRPQIVTRNAGNDLKIAEFDRWAGDLDKDVTRVLAETLSAQFPETPVYVLTGRRVMPADYRVTVHLTRLDPVLGGGVWLEAFWTVLTKDGREAAIRGESSFTEPAQGSDYGAIVSAMSRAVDHLGRDIAGNLRPVIASAARNGTKAASSGAQSAGKGGG